MGTAISIITVCFNNLEELKATCQSVDVQVAKPFEHIVINGSSTDDIKNWLTSSDHPNYRKWVNERDHGIADAFNKGVTMATGEVLLMLNSADKLSDPEVLKKVAYRFDSDKSLMWLHGMYRFQRADIWVTLGKKFDPEKVYRGMRSICHQTMYVKKSLHEKYGLYDTSFKIAMDFDFLVRIRNEKFIFLPEILAFFFPGGTSMQSKIQTLDDITLVLKKNGLDNWQHRLWRTKLKILVTLLDSPAGNFLYWLKVKMKMENI